MSPLDTSTAVLQLQDGQLLRCADTRDVWLTVVRGRVWVTQAHDPDDHFLAAGQAMRLAPGAKAVVGAEGSAQLMVMQGPSRLQRALGITMGLLSPRCPRSMSLTRVQPDEIEWTAIRAQGAGGQNVNKVSSAVHLRFDIAASSLLDAVKARLLALSDQRITGDGVVVIKAQAHRSQDKNRAEALQRLQELVDSVATPPRPRKPTRPTRASKVRRLEGKSQRGQVKAGRAKVVD